MVLSNLQWTRPAYWIVNDKKAHSALTSKIFNRFNHSINQLYEVEQAKPKIEHREAFIVGFFIQQYAKQRKLELF